jgi:hypothetical protein
MLPFIHLLNGDGVRVLTTLEYNLSCECRVLCRVSILSESWIPRGPYGITVDICDLGIWKLRIESITIVEGVAMVRKGSLDSHPVEVAPLAVKQRHYQWKVFQGWRILRQQLQKDVSAFFEPFSWPFRNPGSDIGYTVLELVIRPVYNGLPYFWNPTYIRSRRVEIVGVGTWEAEWIGNPFDLVYAGFALLGGEFRMYNFRFLPHEIVKGYPEFCPHFIPLLGHE